MTKREKLIDRNVGLRLARLSVLPYAKMITEQQAIEEAKYYADNGGDLDYWNRQIEIEMEANEAQVRAVKENQT